MINLRQLQCARALAEHRHFGRAASAVGITQSGLTQNIKGLESFYDVPLFDRSRHGVTPTVYGEALLRGADQILDRVHEIRREIDLLNNLESGQLMVGVDPMLAGTLLAPALAALLERHPGLRFTVVSGGTAELVAALSAQKIDLFLGFPGERQADELDALSLELPAPVVVCRRDHPLLDLNSPSVHEFLLYPLVQGPIAHWYLDWAAIELGSDATEDLLAPYFLQATDVALLVSIAKSSEALLAAMVEDVSAALQSGDLVEILPPRWPERVPAEILWSKSRRQVPAAERLVSEILATVERIGGRQASRRR